MNRVSQPSMQVPIPTFKLYQINSNLSALNDEKLAFPKVLIFITASYTPPLVRTLNFEIIGVSQSLLESNIVDNSRAGHG